MAVEAGGRGGAEWVCGFCWIEAQKKAEPPVQKLRNVLPQPTEFLVKETIA
jgi:hypothetical protein